ncbi:glycosyltransferase family 4 protein [Eionea flava]
MSTTSQPVITYVVSQYPAISHTFILGEVEGLLAQGLNIHVASINNPDRPFDALTKKEQLACQHTTFVKSSLIKKLPFYLVASLAKHPKGFFLSLADTLKACIKQPTTALRQLAYWLEAMVVVDIAKKQGSRQLHAHFSTQGCTVAKLAATIMDIDFSITVHGPDEFYHSDTQQLEKKYTAANFIVCISDFAKSQVMKHTDFTAWGKIHVNYLGVDANQFTPQEKTSANKTPILLCVGRLVNAKGQGVLIQAAKLLAQRNIDFLLQFVGDGPDKGKLEQFSSINALTTQVTFLGKVNHDKILQLQQQADIFVLPSFAEGIPIVLMEAMASGTPCVTTHITGIPELFTHNHDGLLVTPGNATQLADALELLIRQPEKRKSIQDAALSTIKENWCIHRSNQRLADIFTQHASVSTNQQTTSIGH